MEQVRGTSHGADRVLPVHAHDISRFRQAGGAHGAGSASRGTARFRKQCRGKSNGSPAEADATKFWGRGFGRPRAAREIALMSFLLCPRVFGEERGTCEQSWLAVRNTIQENLAVTSMLNNRFPLSTSGSQLNQISYKW